MRLPPIVLTSVLLVAACAVPAPPWTKPGVSAGPAAADFTACRRWADRQVMPAHEDVASDRDANPVRQHDRERLKQRVGALTAECMADRGYLPAKKQP